ncbi:hypothetical protein GOP47_0011615 [Adiantum capillus-veneris]|uniref:Auxin response factor n=1 Tax=Adiantum capillus-veneris TaxID=13818 RepID=A0A9D4UUI0_ADICA|nr:hypothetical protein GOP47_0011615 [Adiantum capillus-veneris]
MDERPPASGLRSCVDPMTNTRGKAGCKGELDPQLWHACAGAMVRMPHVGSKVIYFPQGHAELAASIPEFPPSLGMACMVLCRVLSVKFLADAETDEVYARIYLQPDTNRDIDLHDDSPSSPPLPEKSASFAKTLTQSDANNGGGFSVPRYCAETIFPRLDYSQDPPVQIVLAKDVHGTVWKFRHIYRGTPRRHLLTTGWSNFVNQKKLVAGDAIVFLRNASGELCVGVRRSTRGATTSINASSWHLAAATSASSTASSSSWKLKPQDNSFDFLGSAAVDSSARPLRVSSDTAGTANFARNRARVTEKDVLEAASLAAAGQVFEVVYYPRATISEFCVKAHAVRASLQLNWAPGIRFKMAVETEDASRISWFMGTISRVQEADSLVWPKSPWKMLQVLWDEPEMLQGIVRVSPWQIELVSPMQLPLFSLPKKKPRLSPLPELQLDGMGMSMVTLASNLLGHINPWHELAENESAGMQGARHDGSYMVTSPNIGPSDIHHSLYGNRLFAPHDLYGTTGVRVSTELNVGGLFNERRLNGHTNSLHSLMPLGGSSSGEPALSGDGVSIGQNESCRTSKSTPFLLFGKAIDTSQCINSQLPKNPSTDDISTGGSEHDIPRDVNCRETPGHMHMFFSAQEGRPTLKDFENLSQGQGFGSSFNEARTNGWFKHQARSVGTTNGSFEQSCPYGVGGETCPATVDLSLFDSYEELQDNLSKTYGVQKSEMLNRLICVDSRPIQNEPYRDFTKRVKWLKLLSEFSGEDITRLFLKRVRIFAVRTLADAQRNWLRKPIGIGLPFRTRAAEPPPLDSNFLSLVHCIEYGEEMVFFEQEFHLQKSFINVVV